MKYSLIEGTLSYYIGLIIMILIPLHIEYTPPFMILWAVVWIVAGTLQTFKEHKAINLNYKLFLLFLLFFLFQTSGLIYSDNLHNGLVKVFRGLSFIVFPLVLFYPGEWIKNKVGSLLKVFAFSTAIYIFSCLVYAFYRSIYFSGGTISFNPVPVSNYWNNYFFGPEFSYAEHHMYTAMYAVFSVFIALETWFDKNGRQLWRIFWLLAALFLIGSLYFLSSRAGLISIVVLLPFYLIKRMEIIKKKWLFKIAAIIIVSIGFLVFISNQWGRDYLRIGAGTSINEILKTDERGFYWKSSAGVIMRNPLFGVGIGDSSEEMTREFMELGYSKGLYGNMNAHNQFLEVLMNSGIAGLSLFLAIIVLMFYISIKQENLIYGVFIIMIVLFFLFESVLNRLAGVSFFAVFSFLLLYWKQDSKNSNTTTYISQT